MDKSLRNTAENLYDEESARPLLTIADLYKFTTGRGIDQSEVVDPELSEIQLDLAKRLEQLLNSARDAIDTVGYSGMPIYITTLNIHKDWLDTLYDLYAHALAENNIPRLRLISQYIQTLIAPLSETDERGEVHEKVSDQFATDLRNIDANIQDFLRDNEVLSKSEVS